MIYLHYAVGIVPLVTESRTASVVTEGETLAIAPSVSAGIPASTYYWYKNGSHISSGATPIYVLGSVPANAGGTYSLVASNMLGISSNVVADVTIKVPLNLSFLTLKVGDTLECHVLGSASHAFFVQGTSNFLNWIPLYTNVTPFAPINFIDPAAAIQPLRFYRARPWP